MGGQAGPDRNRKAGPAGGRYIRAMRPFLQSRAGAIALSLAALLSARPASVRAQQSGTDQSRLFAAVDSMAAAAYATDSIASITVGIVDSTRLVWTHSYGYADIGAHRLANRNTEYRIGSITKPFTAVMLMQLAEAGKVHLSDPVEDYLPEVTEIRGAPPGARPFTFIQLATMTAGLAREPEREGPFWTGSVATWEKTLLSALPHTTYIAMPGTKYSYSNIGYAILGAALSRIAGVPYVQWERTRVLAPLGVDHTRFQIDPAIAANVARGYDVSRSGVPSDSVPDREARTGRGYKVPNGALFTTVGDLARFVSFEMGDGPDSVLPRARLDSAFNGIVASSDNLSGGYGLGFMAHRLGNFAYVGHAGSVAGYLAAMFFVRSAQRGVIVFRNATGGRVNPSALAAHILERVVAATRTTTDR